MTRAEYDFRALRDEAIPLPPREPDGYRHVLLLGTTGAGKTTLVRQLIGTDPSTERFPSTSTSKTTIHDTEIILDNGGWRAAVTFVSRDEVRLYLEECIIAAVLEIFRHTDETKVMQVLLNHVNQRFRFSYVLGTGPRSTNAVSYFDDENEAPRETSLYPMADERASIDLSATTELLRQSMKRLRDLVSELLGEWQRELNPSAEDQDFIEELLEAEARDHPTFREIADSLMDEMAKRFALLPPGTVTRTGQGWPLSWRGDWPVKKREEFLRSVSMFSSNYKPLYGQLLTPLVNGIRVAGPFSPKWWSYGPTPKLVLFDGEGLGHTSDTSTSVSTGVSQLIEVADAVVLVDNAEQPMLAGPEAAMRELVATGNGSKLILAFTHFDQVKGDNLPSADDKAQYVLASAENLLSRLRELDVYAERSLRERLRGACFFLANLQASLLENTPTARRTVRQLTRLVVTIDHVIERPEPTEASPVYDRNNLVLAIDGAARAFHTDWRLRLGLESEPGSREKEHWARIKALNRRLAEKWKDDYKDLRPVADLRRELRDQMWVFIHSPLYWEGPQPSGEEKQAKYNAFADSLGARLRKLSTRRVWEEHIKAWERAYQERGMGSTFVRARIIGNEIYAAAAPVPKSTLSPDSNPFVREVVAQVEGAAGDAGARFL